MEERNAHFSGVFYARSTRGGASADGYGGYNAYLDLSRGTAISNENRPINKAVNYYIRAVG